VPLLLEGIGDELVVGEDDEVARHEINHEQINKEKTRVVRRIFKSNNKEIN
jgi:hypothetical protein